MTMIVPIINKRIKKQSIQQLLAILVLAILAVFLSSCSKESQAESLSHTVIFYLGGNNNLSSSIESQISELQAGYTSSSANVFVYAALPSGASLRQLFVGASPRIITDYDQSNSADAATLTEVIAACCRIAPAKVYTLVIASHASGWLPAGTLQSPQCSQLGRSQLGRSQLGRSIIRDESDALNEMELADFAAAIPDGMFDTIIIEACLMGGVEVAYALRNKAHYLLAAPAELLAPGFTPIYRHALRTLCSSNSDMRSALIAFAEQYMTYVNRLWGNNRSATLSIIDLGRMEYLAETFAHCVGELPIASQPQLAKVQHFDRPGWYGDRPARARFFDFEDAVRQLIGDAQADELLCALDRTVIWKRSTPEFMPSLGGFTINRFCGLTLYVPQAEFAMLNTAYRGTAWWQRITLNADTDETNEI